MTVAMARLDSLQRDVKLGRIPATDTMKRRTLPLGPYLKRYGGKPPPTAVTWQTKAQRSLGEMLGNDQYGDCVLAATMHGIGVWSANEPGGKEALPSTKETVAQYQSICGPGDNGCYIPAVLDHFRDHGLTVGGVSRKIDGYVSVNPRDELLVKTATHLFGGLHLGINWPADWSREAKPGAVLRPTNSSIVGGHAIQVVGYDSVGLQVATWGFVCTLSWEALASSRWVDECYAMIGEDWYNAKGETAAGAGVDVEKLRGDLAIIKGGGTPDIPGDDPTPPVPPTPIPDGDWLFHVDRTFNALGYAMHVVAGVQLHKAASALRGVSWWVISGDVLKIITAFARRDWAMLASAVEQLLHDMGIAITRDDLRGIGEAMRTHVELLPLTDSGPPVGR